MSRDVSKPGMTAAETLEEAEGETSGLLNTGFIEVCIPI